MVVSDLAILARYLADADSNNLPDATLLVLFNDAYDALVGKLQTETAGGKWPFGDVNYSAFPTYTVNLVNSQETYEIDSLSGPLIITGVEVLDNLGIWHNLTPITLQDINRQGIAQPEFFKTDGLPQFYEKREHELVLYPAPDNGVRVTLTSGLRVFFMRGASDLANVTSTTITPGFPSPWHSILAYDSALTHCGLYKPERVNFIMSRLKEKDSGLLRFIGKRDSQDTKVIRNSGIIYR